MSCKRRRKRRATVVRNIGARLSTPQAGHDMSYPPEEAQLFPGPVGPGKEVPGHCRGGYQGGNDDSGHEEPQRLDQIRMLSPSRADASIKRLTRSRQPTISMQIPEGRVRINSCTRRHMSFRGKLPPHLAAGCINLLRTDVYTEVLP
jgi:hypothetical protein